MRHIALLLMTVFVIVGGIQQQHKPKCVDGKARLKNGRFQCDHLVTAALRVSPGSDPSQHKINVYELLPYYEDLILFRKDSERELPTCTTNADCNTHKGTVVYYYCYPARNLATDLIVKDKMFCFAADNFAPRYHYYLDPKVAGYKYCETHADCAETPYVSYNPWFCHITNDYADSNGKNHSGVCMRTDYCPYGGKAYTTNGSLTLDGNECTSDESCRGAGLASVDTANHYKPICETSKYDSLRRSHSLCCQEKLPSCSFGLNFHPRTTCQSDSDCTKLAKNNVCDPEQKICCDGTVSAYLKDASFGKLTKILSNQPKLDQFYLDKGSALAAEFKKEFEFGFNSSAIDAILAAHNELRESIANGSFIVDGETLPATKNMKPLKWSKNFEGHAKAAAIKSCTQNVDNYNIEVFPSEGPNANGWSPPIKDPKEYGVKAVQNWETKLRNEFKFMREDSEMIAIPYKDIVLRLIFDSVSEVGCAYTKCAPYYQHSPIVACHYGTIADQEYVYQIVE